MLSDATIEHLDRLVEMGWPGSVLVVGSVAEAREALHATPRAVVTESDDSTRGQGLRLDADSRRVLNPPAAESLTPLEYGLLETLLREPGKVVGFADLTRIVWGTTYTGDCSHLHAVVRRLRIKLEAISAPVHLAAVRGIGFRLAPLAPAPERPRGGALRSL
ncbi:winged helix-turn-helix domain-containing protein [Serinicoccus kebangsaanensis]|uniref:winged helix-turn-helix domain-containing protein n=1 Tax=Serinicoccus kebangsaanensis TaxID=2602069 RepID=UPI00192D9B7E|nr:winged helix-turn-helix domain-containing protein [Serinicoccus kebangsaanensis]